MLVRVDIIDLHSKTTQYLGYSVLNVFTKQGSAEQPSDANLSQFCLNEGAFQIPIMLGVPAKADGISAKCLLKYKRLPCATVLIRIEGAAKDDEGNVLSISSTPKEEWMRMGIVKKPPNYQSRVYHSQLALPSPTENNLVR